MSPQLGRTNQELRTALQAAALGLAGQSGGSGGGGSAAGGWSGASGTGAGAGGLALAIRTAVLGALVGGGRSGGGDSAGGAWTFKGGRDCASTGTGTSDWCGLDPLSGGPALGLQVSSLTNGRGEGRHAQWRAHAGRTGLLLDGGLSEGWAQRLCLVVLHTCKE